MSFNFDEYVVEDESIKDSPDQKPQGFNFDEYVVKEEPTKLQELGRHAARISSRIGETVLGMPGDFVQFGKWIGDKLPKLPSWLEGEPDWFERQGQKALESLPTSTELHEWTSNITNGFTEPQGAFEEFGDSIVELASILSLGKDPTKIKNLLGAIGKATVAKGASKTAEELGASPGAQAATELGVLSLMALKDQKMASKFVSDKYQKARELVPKDVMLPTQKLNSELKQLEKELSKGISTSTKTDVKAAIQELRGKTSGGSLPAEELVQSFHDINEKMSTKRLFDELSKSQQKVLKHRYNQLKSSITSEIGEYGKNNPEFMKEWSEANQAYKTIQDSRKVSTFLEKHIGKVPSHVASGVAIELFLGHPHAAAATAGGFGALKSGEMIYRIAKSPSLRSHYLDVMKHSLEENIPATVRSLSKLDEELKNSFAE